MQTEQYTLTAKTIKAYAACLWEQERTESTINKYIRNLTARWKWPGGRVLDKAALIGWKEQLATSYVPASVNSMLAAVNGYLAFMGWRKLTRAEYVRLVRAAEQEGNELLALILQTICATGIRVSELRFITAESASTGRAEITGKGKHCTVFLSDKLRRLL